MAARPFTPPELLALARSLGSEEKAAGNITEAQYVDNVVGWVRNNVETEFRYGLSKGAVGALIDLYGAPFDQAELAVELLRLGGVTASYRLGDVTMSAPQFGHWTGLAYNVANEPSELSDPYEDFAAQTFAVDAKAACQFLADGGIPALVNGSSSCGSLSGALTTATVSHIWLVVGTQAHDPSLKAHFLYPGIDLPAAMGCGTQASSTCGASMVDTTGVTIGSQNGATTISDPDTIQTLTSIIAKAANLADSIRAGGADRDVVKVLGGMKIAPSASAAAFMTSGTSYAAAGPLIAGDLPNQYRTTLAVTVPSIGTCMYYADELAGQRLLVTGNTNNGINMAVEDRSMLVGPEPHPCAGGGASAPAGHLLLTVNYPYAAQSGTHGDRTIDFPIIEPAVDLLREHTGTFLVDGASHMFSDASQYEASTSGSYPMVIVHGFGKASPSAERYASDLNSVRPLKEPIEGIPCRPSTTVNVISATCAYSSMALGTELIRVRTTSLSRMVDGTVRSASTLHDQLGVLYSGRNAGTKYITVSAAYAFASPDPADSGAGKRAFELMAAGQPAIESHTINDYAQALRKEKPDLVARPQSTPTLMVPPSAMASVLGAMPNPPGLLAGEQQFVTGWKQRLQAAANAGFTVIMNDRWGFGSGEVFVKPGELSYTFWGGVKGGQIADPFNDAMTSVEVSRKAEPRPAYSAVSLADGELSFSVPPDLVTGSGEFPSSLAFQRSYRPSESGRFEATGFQYQLGQSPAWVGSTSARYTGPEQEVSSRLGGAWTHNFNVSATYSWDFAKAVGEGRAIEAATTIAALVGMNDFAKLIAADPGILNRINLLSFQRLIAPVQVVVVRKSTSSESFTSLPNGQFNAQGGGAQFGSADALGVTPPAGVNTPLFSSPLTYLGTDGEAVFFGRYSRLDYVWTPGCSRVTGGPTAPAYSRAEPIFLADAMTWPDGMKVTLSYDEVPYYTALYTLDACTYGKAQILKKVSNNLGREISFAYSVSSTAQALYDDGNTFTQMVDVPTSYRIDSITDANGRSATFARTDCGQLGTGCATFAVTNPTNGTTTYRYAPTTASPDPALAMRLPYRMRSWSAPSSPSNDAEVIRYDDYFRVAKVTDINNVVTEYYAGGLLGAELFKPGRRRHAYGVSLAVHDDDGNVVRAEDELARATRSVFDGFNRQIRQVLPEGNEKRRSYDWRSNLLEERAVAKPGTGLADIVVSYSYTGTPLQLPWGCSNFVTCNKLIAETDANGSTTDYNWSPTKGTLTKVRRPLVEVWPGGTSLRPQIDLAYTTMGGISFLTQKTEKIDASASTITTYTYDSANHYVLKSVAQDAGGTNFTTCLRYDAVGNLIASTPPNGTTGGCP